MSVIPHPVSMATVKGLAGTVDFYFQRGRQIARSWPRKSNLIPTPAQKIQRDNFAAIENWLKSQSRQQRSQWQAWQPPVGQTWVDYVHRVQMSNAAYGTLVNVNDFLRYRVILRFPWPNNTLRVDWDHNRYPSPPLLAVIRTRTTPDEPRWRWQVFDNKIQRGRFTQPRWGPRIGPYFRSLPNYRNFKVGFAWYFIPAIWTEVSFAFINPVQADDLSLQSACAYASPST